MAYAYDPNLEEDQDQAAAGGNTQLAGGDQVVGATAPGTQSGGQAKDPNAPTKSDSFQNLNDYIDANDSAGFGNKFVGKLQSDIDTAGATQQASGQKFKTLSDSSTVAPNTELVDSALSDPYGFTQNADNVSAFKKQRDASYNGPYSYADSGDSYQQAYSATKKATEEAQNAQTEGGRFALLDNYFGRPDYTSGQKGLDNLLLSGTQSTQDAISQAAKNAQVAQVGFEKQAGDLSDYAAGNVSKAEQARAYARNALGLDESGNLKDQNAIKSVVDAADQRAKGFNAQQETDYNAALNNLKSNGLSAAQMQQFGLSPTQLWGVDPTQFLNKTDAATAAKAQTPDEARKIAALSQLADVQNTFLDPSVAGTYDPAKDLAYRTGDFNTAVASGKAATEPHLQRIAQLDPLASQAQNSLNYWSNMLNSNTTDPGAMFSGSDQDLAPYSEFTNGISYGGGAARGLGGIVDAANARVAAYQQILQRINAAKSAENGALPVNWNAYLNQLG